MEIITFLVGAVIGGFVMFLIMKDRNKKIEIKKDGDKGSPKIQKQQ